MKPNDGGLAPNDEDILSFDVSDAELEATAAPAALPLASFSFPNAPTVSVLVVCCSNDSPEQG